MVVSTLNPNTDSKKKAKEILVDSASIEALKGGDKNVQISVVAHPALMAAIIADLATDPNNVLATDGKLLLKRTVWSATIRQDLAARHNYTGELTVVGRGRGGNVIGLVSAFKTTVGSMFELAQAMGALTQMPEEQIKAFAFAKAKESISSHPQLQGIEVSDDALEAIWAGNEIALADDDDDDDDDDDE